MLHLITLALLLGKEGVDGMLHAPAVGTLAVPEQAFLGGRQRVVGGKDGEARALYLGDEGTLPLAHDVAAPAGHGIIVKAERRVGHDQTLVDADGGAEAFAAGAGAEGRIEGEELVGGLGEGHAVGLEAGGEGVEHVRGVDAQGTLAVAFVKGGLDGVGQTCQGVALAVDGQAVYHEPVVLDALRTGGSAGLVGLVRGLGVEQGIARGVLLEKVLYIDGLPVDVQARHSLLQIGLELGAQGAAGMDAEGGEDGHAGAGAVGLCGGHDVIDGVAAHLGAAHGGEGVAGAGEEQAQIVVYLGAGAYGGARVARTHFLLDGDGGGKALDAVALGFVHTAQKLPRIGRQTLHIAAAALGVERVEGQRRFARPRQARHHDKALLGNVQTDVLQVIDAYAAQADASGLGVVGGKGQLGGVHEMWKNR